MNNTSIILKGIKVNNLKNINVEIPANRLVVVTGLSGSGKSSLVFDTIYAEGQRRYVESLNAYARQFFGKINKPVVDFVQGIPPAIAIEQKVTGKNSRSTLGTMTEIYEYVKLLYARLGKTVSPVSGEEVKRDTVSDVVDYIFKLPQETKIMILSPLSADENRTLEQKIKILGNQGFSRIYRNRALLSIPDALEEENLNADIPTFLLVDRCTALQDEENKSRVSDSIETAYFEGHGKCLLLFIHSDGREERKEFSNTFEADGILFRKPSVNMFTFTNSYGACPECNGTGIGIGVDPDLVIPDKSLSVFDNAVVCWKGEKMREFKEELIQNAYRFDFPIYKPIKELHPAQYRLLWTGNAHFAGIDGFFTWVESNTYKIQYRVLLSRYLGKVACKHCQGSRLHPDAEYVKIADKSISQVCSLPAEDALAFFRLLVFDSPSEKKIADFLLREITVRLQFLVDLGLSYLTLNRLSSTLSGGEYQRVNLATSLGSSLVGALYILDEPSVGLHSIDTRRLIRLLKHLRDIGNTVLVVEHDEDIIKAADYVIDVGPLAGAYGGEIVFAGELSGLNRCQNSITAQYLTGKQGIVLPAVRKPFLYGIQLQKACLHNLKSVTVQFPIGVLTVVTGISGSGKSSLITGVLYKELQRYFDSIGSSFKSAALGGDLGLIAGVELVDQNPIGRSSRSNPVTYTGAFHYIRELFAEQSISRSRGYKPGFFSLNVSGGRCNACLGEGFITIEMQFMSDVEIVCEECKGKRYQEEVFDVKVNGKSIADVLNMSVDEAVDFFTGLAKNRFSQNAVLCLKALQDVGLGYLQLGQSSSSLSGGEAQRVKLATFLAKASSEKSMLFIFDEPTTGLHLHDIQKLYDTFRLLIAQGHTIIVIEHNLELIKCADWIIDMGPEGGDRGGNIVFAGLPEDLLHCKDSLTASFLKDKIKQGNVQ
jgi:excinuclease ABC subunit A